jgi:deoxyribodipyrimidine photo-lyase
MYYNLLDGDWASNALSWQWVADTFSSKKYIANQENINTYTNSKQRGTYLDTIYEVIANAKPPTELLEASILEL